MNNLPFTTLPLNKALNSFSFYIPHKYSSYDNMNTQQKLDYRLKSSNIYEPESKINIYLDDFDYSYRSNHFKNLDDLLNDYIESYIKYLNDNISDILNQNIFSKILNKQKNNNLIDDLNNKIEYLNKLLNDDSKSNIEERFKFMKNHFEFAFITNNPICSLDHSSFFINITEANSIGDSIFLVQKNNLKLINLKVLSKNVNFRFNLTYQLEAKNYTSHFKIKDIVDIKSEQFYSFDYKLQDIDTDEIFFLQLDYSKGKYSLKNKKGQEQNLFFLTQEACLNYINNQKEKINQLENQINNLS